MACLLATKQVCLLLLKFVSLLLREMLPQIAKEWFCYNAVAARPFRIALRIARRSQSAWIIQVGNVSLIMRFRHWKVHKAACKAASNNSTK